jgi:hypothetical protein
VTGCKEKTEGNVQSGKDDLTWRDALHAVRDRGLQAQRLAQHCLQVRPALPLHALLIDLGAEARESSGVREEVENGVRERGAGRVGAREDREPRLGAKRAGGERRERPFAVLVQLPPISTTLRMKRGGLTR